VDRRAAAVATPGAPFGRRAGDRDFLKKAYPAGFVAQAANQAVNQAVKPPQSAPHGPQPPMAGKAHDTYRRAVPCGLIVDETA
jgi:hypothetical protein